MRVQLQCQQVISLIGRHMELRAFVFCGGRYRHERVNLLARTERALKTERILSHIYFPTKHSFQVTAG